MKATPCISSLEVLESRIAPAALLLGPPADLEILNHGKTARFTDADGDLAIFVTTKGVWTESMFTAVPDNNPIFDASALISVTIPVGANFDGANITITAKLGQFGGNGAVNFETLDATGVNLGNVTIHGALGNILAGSGGTVPALKLLQVQSLGELGAINMAAPPPTFVSSINGNVNKLTVTSDVRHVDFEVTGALKAVAIGGSFEASKLAVTANLGPVNIHGNLEGTDAATPSIISAFGQKVAPKNGLADTAIASLTVGGRVEFAHILAGYGLDGTPLNADASVGAVTVGTDWIASSMLVGISAGMDGYAGSLDDELINGPGVRDVFNRFSTIASLTIKGQTYGTVATDDSYGIVAEQIKLVKIGGVKLPFTTGAHSPEDFFYVSTTGPNVDGEIFDFVIFEVSQ